MKNGLSYETLMRIAREVSDKKWAAQLEDDKKNPEYALYFRTVSRVQ